MPLLALVLALFIVGVSLWLLNTYGGPYCSPAIMRLINVVVIVACVFYVASAFGLFDYLRDIRVPRAR